MSNGGNRDFEAILAEAWATKRCAECGTDLDPLTLLRSVFCSSRCSTRFGDRRRYHASRAAQLERARRYYLEHRERILKRQSARRAEVPTTPRYRSECSAELAGRQRITCGKSACRERRFKRLHPDSYAKREAAKVERRREARRAKREGGTA